MNIKTFFIAFGIVAITASCEAPDPNEQIDEGSVTKNIYTSEDIGWTIEIPEGWTVTTKAARDATNEKGLELIEQMDYGEIDVSGLNDLIGFKRNLINQFSSTSQKFEEEWENEWIESQQFVKNFVCEAYTSQGMKFDTTSGVETIDNLQFQVFSADIYGPDNSIVFHQKMYGRLINGFDFAANLMYNNEKDKEDMMKALKTSTFRSSKNSEVTIKSGGPSAN